VSVCSAAMRMARTLSLVISMIVVPAAACNGGDGDVDLDAGNGGDGGGGGGAPAIDAAPTAGCGTTQPTGVQNGTIAVAGADRTYVLFVPAGYDPSRPTPLVFAWHGRTGTAANARAYFGIEAASAGAAIVVYPQGLPVSADPGDTGWELTATGRDVMFYDALSARLRDTYCVGSAYSMGHSFGGYMSNALGCFRGGTDPGEVRAIAPIAGGGPFGACPGDPVSAVVIHGMTDMVVPFTQGEGSRDVWRGDAGCELTSSAITPSPCVAYDGCDGGRAVRWCAHGETAFMGHGWPSWAAAATWALFQATP
jgi:polyhydroxybutyrate depolymerase